LAGAAGARCAQNRAWTGGADREPRVRLQGWRPGTPGPARITKDERASVLTPDACGGLASGKRLRSTSWKAFF